MTKFGPCAICGKPAVESYKPFCSKRCADIDLNRWFTGGYAVPGEDADHADVVPSSPDEVSRFDH
ncbi:MAG: DNA gyrase inhibitor YacG [Parvularculaceae bacterium]|nr:DNA gyrase inhibitor YacG [Parvularculaceae bacterium]